LNIPQNSWQNQNPKRNERNLNQESTGKLRAFRKWIPPIVSWKLSEFCDYKNEIKKHLTVVVVVFFYFVGTLNCHPFRRAAATTSES
jgi:hypothetical protein